MPSASRSETDEHKELKLLSVSWAQAECYTCCGFEIRLPDSGYRADVAAYRPESEIASVIFEGKTLRRRQAVLGATAVFECKQARADLLKDSCPSAKTTARLKTLHEKRATMERLLKVHHPWAANGESLFPEFDTFNFEALNHNGYRKVRREIAAAQNGLFFKNKFEELVRYNCANLFYLVATEGIIEDYELPLDWGLLVKTGDALMLKQRPVWHDASPASRLAILQRIAVKTTRF
jgi:hypothetical protein